MKPFYTTDTAEGVERIEKAWTDAPTTNLELCELIFETAREQVLAYAPELPETGEIVPGPPRVTRRNLFRDPRAMRLESFSSSANVATTLVADFPGAPSAVRSTRTDAGSAVRLIDFVVGASMPVTGQEVAVTFDVRASESTQILVQVRGDVQVSGTGRQMITRTVPAGVTTITVAGLSHPGATSTARAGVTVTNNNGTAGSCTDFTNIQIEAGGALLPVIDGNSPDRIDGGLTYEYAWEGAEFASPTVESYRPDVFLRTWPNRLVYAQLQQARTLWLAGRTDEQGGMGGDFSFTPRPLDKTIRDIIRPVDGKPNVL